MITPNVMENIFIWEYDSSPVEEIDYETTLTPGTTTTEISLSLYHLSPYFLPYIGVYLNDNDIIKKWGNESNATLLNGSKGYGLWIKIGDGTWERFTTSYGMVSSPITIYSSDGLQANTRISIKLQLKVPRSIEESFLPKVKLDLTYLAKVN